MLWIVRGNGESERDQYDGTTKANRLPRMLSTFVSKSVRLSKIVDLI